jgi:hypothetical protein
VSEASSEGALFADCDSSPTNISGARKPSTEKHAIAAEGEACQQQWSATLLVVDLESSAAGPTFASYEPLGAQLFSYSSSQGPESVVQFLDPNSSKPQVLSVTDS